MRNVGGEDLGQATSVTKVGVAAFISALDALCVMVAALISFVSVYLATESFREDLTEELVREPGASGAGQTT